MIPYSQLSKKQKKRRRLASEFESNCLVSPESDSCRLSVGHILNTRSNNDDRSVGTDHNRPTSTCSISSPPSFNENFTEVAFGEDGRGPRPTCSNESYTDSQAYSTSSPKLCSAPSTSNRSQYKNLADIADGVENALKDWLKECPNVPDTTVSNLLGHLKKTIPDIKTTAKYFRNINLNFSISPMYNGRYSYISSWKDSVLMHLNCLSSNINEIEVSFNVDGIPVFNDSRKNHAYPILMKVFTNPSKIFCIGLYLSEKDGMNKMPHVNDLMFDFVQEMKVILRDGLTVGERIVNVRIKAFVCDAPARACLKSIVGHNSYNSCERCVQEGEICSKRVVLPGLSCERRTDESFLNKDDLNHHQLSSLPILKDLGIGFVSNFVLDYMHLICLGVTKRLLVRLKSTKKCEIKCNLNKEQLIQLDHELEKMKRFIPSEFNRKLNGGLGTLLHWKATEFRFFLLYGGLVALKDILDDNYYLNFLYFSISIRLMLQPFNPDHVTLINNYINKFITSSITLYGKSFLSYNVHSLVHVVDDYIKFGSLDNVSCFDFENYLGKIIKGRLTGRNRVLEQITKHVTVENNNPAHSFSSRITKHSFSLSKGETIKKYDFSKNDSCILLKTGDIALVRAFKSDSIDIEYLIKDNFFNIPVNSNELGIFKVSRTLNETCATISHSDICSKMVLLPKADYFVALKMLHSFPQC